MSAFHADTIAAVQQSLATTVKNTQVARTSRDKYAAEAREAAREFEASLVREADLRKLLRHMDPQNTDKYAEPPTLVDLPRRTELLDGLRQAIEYFQMHPDVPTPASVNLHIFPNSGSRDRGLDAEEAEIASIAAAMGLKAERTAPNCHFEAETSFGRHVRLVVCSTKRTMADWKEGDPYPDWWPSEQPAAADPEQPAAETPWQPAELDAYDPALEAYNELGAGNAADDCGKRAVDLEGRIGRCIRTRGHRNALLSGYDATQSRHYDPAFGEWDDPADTGGEVLDERMQGMGEPVEVEA